MSGAPPPLPLRAPRRAMSGWALVRRGGALRAPRRWVVLRSGSVCVLDNPESRSPVVVMPLSNAAVTTNPGALQAVVKSPDGLKMTFTWPCAEDLQAFKAAFDFANRVIDSRFKTVSHRLLTRRPDSEIVFGFDKATGEHAAIKVLSKDRAHNKTIAECEVAIRMSIDHATIVRTVDVFETPFDLFIVMTYMNGGSLANRILSREYPPITEAQARVIMARLFSALHYLHARGVVHRNVKPENVLLEHPGEPRWPDTVRLNDFAKACFLYPELAPSADAAEYANQVVGTPDYLAPEAAVMIAQPDGSRRPCLGPETDMWAAGVTLYNILSQGGLPFGGATTPEVLRNARHAAVPFDGCEPFMHVSTASMSLIRALLNPDRRKRPTALSVLYHPWFDNFDPRIPGPVMRDPPLVGYQKFRVAASSVRFLCRMCRNTPGMPQLLSSSGPRTMRFVSMVAPVGVSPAIISTTKGVDIAPSAPPPGASAAAAVGGTPASGTMTIFNPNAMSDGPTQPPIMPMTMQAVHHHHHHHPAVVVTPQAYPHQQQQLQPHQPQALEHHRPFQFTTSTLQSTPADGVLLRTSQTSSAGSFRSSHDSSRVVAQDSNNSLQQLRQQQADDARRHAQMELQQQRELMRAQHAADMDRRDTDPASAANVDLPYMNATPRNVPGGLIGGLMGAMRRDASPATSNPGSRAASNLGHNVANNPVHGGASAGELSMDSTRSQMRTSTAAVREESCLGDESMGSCSSSQTGSHRSMQPPMSDSRPGSDLQMMMAGGGEFGGAAGTEMAMRADSAVELADLAPALTLSAGIMPVQADQNMTAHSTPSHSLRYHSGLRGGGAPQASPLGAAPLTGGHPNLASQATVFPDSEDKSVQGTPGSSSKVKRSVRKKFDGLRNATHGQFTGFGVYHTTKDKG